MKQRLIGAVVLIALAVIFLPLLVKDPAPDSGVSGVSLRMPAAPQASGDTITEDLPLDAPGAAPAGGATGMPAPVSGQPATPEPDAAAAAATPIAAVAAGNFVVGFGNYKSVADADKVIAALRAAGLPGYREKITLGGSDAQRVRIGPFVDQASAESARIRAGRVSSGVDAKVVTLDATPDAAPAAAPVATPPKAVAAEAPKPAAEAPKPAAPAPKPETAAATPKPAATEPPPTAPASAAGTGFVVQVGAFASAANATALRDVMRKAGFNAFTDTVPGSNGGSLTRVRVGPVMTRAEADALKARVKDKTGKEGSVLPHP